MTDDIVTRLREAERLVRNSDMDCDDIGDLIGWCADTIEELSKQVNGWRGICEQFAESDPRFYAFSTYFRVVHGEQSKG